MRDIEELDRLLHQMKGLNEEAEDVFERLVSDIGDCIDLMATRNKLAHDAAHLARKIREEQIGQRAPRVDPDQEPGSVP